MSAKTTPEFIASQMRAMELPYYVISDNTGKNIFDMNEDVIEASLSADKLLTTFENFSTGIVKVTISDKSRREKGKGGNLGTNFTYSVLCSSKSDSSIGALMNMQDESGSDDLSSIGGIRGYMDERLEAKDREYELKTQITELKRQIADDEKESPLMGMAAQLLPLILGKANIPQPIVAGPPTGDNEVDEQVKVNELISRLKAVEPNYLVHLESLVELAETDQETFQFALTFLKKK